MQTFRYQINLLLLLWILPLTGIVWNGRDVKQFLEFPPLTQYVVHSDFSWIAFAIMSFIIISVLFPFFWHRSKNTNSIRDVNQISKFPIWGWIGVILLVISWILAWTRFEWFKPCQLYTFTPLWFSYILIVNALTYRRTSKCMITHRPWYFISLFLISTFFWWYFEYLNRFVQNWHYINIEGISGLQYFSLASLSFSTVLPAVLGTYELLDSFTIFGANFNSFKKINLPRPKLLASLAFLFFSACLALIGIFPDYLYPFLWVSPLFIIISYRIMYSRDIPFPELKQGNWRRFVLLSLSALICGVFWELWNYYSFAKWVYSVPFVNRFHVFEMPILGFAGYLPFGLECAVASEFFLITSSMADAQQGPNDFVSQDKNRNILKLS